MNQRRPLEERVAEIDKKISFYKGKITDLEQKREVLTRPPIKPPKVTTKFILSKAKECGMTNEEIAKKLGIKVS